MMRRGLILALALGTLLSGCSQVSHAGAASTGSEAVAEADASVGAVELPLPAVPSSLRVPQERADYVMAHFWDAMDFSDTTRTRSRGFMELNLVNFMSLFPHGSGEGVSGSLGGLLRKVAADPEALDVATGIIEQYLSEPNSPMRNESAYIAYLEVFLQLPGLPEAERVRPAHQLAMAKKNRPGAMATDFTYTDRAGRRQMLHATAPGRRLLLLFYDPECSHCEEIMKQVAESATVSDCIGQGSLVVLAVYTEGKRSLWDETKASMPQEWMVGIDESEIVDRELYDIPAMPVMYLLDSNRRVLLKDAILSDIEAALS